MKSILGSTVPDKKQEDCNPQEIDCSDGISGSNLSGNYEIIFPNFLNNTLPLSGGAIAEIDIKEYKISFDENIQNILNNQLSFLSNINPRNSLDSLVQVRNSFSRALFNLKRIKIDSAGIKKDAPNLYLSIYRGDDSNLKSNIPNPDVVKICNFKLIPPSVFSIMLSIVNESLDFSDTVGISGRTFGELEGIAEDISSKEDIIDLILDIFPIFNIDEDEILKKGGSSVIGGYYTIYNDKIYLKTPDISGRDSAGYFDELFSETTNLYFEIEYGLSNFNRIKIDKWKAPPTGTIDDGNLEIPESGTLEIPIETDLDSSEISGAYLSIVNKNPRNSSVRPLEGFFNQVELFSIPVISKNDFFKDRPGTIALSLDGSIDENNSALISNISDKEDSIKRFFSDFNFSNIEDISSLGFPFVESEISSVNFFGEKNRPEIILSDKDNFSASNKNEKRYYSPKIYGALGLLNCVRSRLYSNIPAKWIKADNIVNASEGFISLEFRKSLFDNINLDSQEGQAEFVIYLSDSLGQFTRVSGGNLKILKALPGISEISPNGFAGSEEILATDESASFTFDGDSLAGAKGAEIVVGTAEPFKVFFDNRESVVYTPGNDTSQLNFRVSLQSIGFVPGFRHLIRLISSSGETGNQYTVYVNENEGDALPAKDDVRISFTENDLSIKRFEERPISGIPILTNEDNAEIIIRSRQKIFSGEAPIFCYLAFNQSDLNVAETISGDDYVFLNNNLVIPKNVEYSFSKSESSDFAKLSNRRARLNFPGRSYSQYNFNGLLNLEEAWFVFTNESLNDISSSGSQVSLEDDAFSLIKIGDGETPPFILPSVIHGLIVDNPGSANYISTLQISEQNSSEIKNEFSQKEIVVSAISAFEKIEKLGIIFSGICEPNIKNKYKFYIGNTEITRNLSRKIRPLNEDQCDGKLFAVFEDIYIEEEGDLSVYIEKNDKIFNYKSNSKNIRKRTSLGIGNKGFTLERNTGILSLNVDSPSQQNPEASNALDTGQAFWYGDDFITQGFTPNYLELILPDGNSGIITDTRASDGLLYSFYYPKRITPNVSIKINGDVGNGLEEISVPALTPSDFLFSLSKLSLSIPSGAEFSSGQFSISDNDNAVAYLDVEFSENAVIRFNSPEVYALSVNRAAATPEPIEVVNGSRIVAGKEIEVYVRNTKKNLVVLFGDIPVTPTNVTRVSGEAAGTYRAAVRVPDGVNGPDCIDVCASTSNSNRNRAKVSLGKSQVVELEKRRDAVLFGNTKDKIPDPDELKERLQNAPLRFLQLAFDKAAVPTELLNNFCDFSFSITADLKLALNGFQTLLVPVQVIFCIIDVICALLNPIKLAKAIVRLFVCLYDLLLLLPQISVPVMFLQLALHLIVVLECLIVKLVELFATINEIIDGIQRATRQDNSTAVRTLEEILTEYVLQVKVELEILEPAISVIAIFLELLQLTFNFPCQINPGEGDASCGLDGTLISGIVAGKIDSSGLIDPSVLIPFAQNYTKDEIEDAASDGRGSVFEEYSSGDNIVQVAEQGFFDNLNINQDSLRTVNGEDFEASFSASVTKSRKGFGDPTIVEFQFKERANNDGVFSNKKIIDPDQNQDSPLGLFEKNGSDIIVSSDFGNFISSKDGEQFIKVASDKSKGTVLPLILTFDVPIYRANEETGEFEQVGSNKVTRTFDDIPRMAIVDEEFNLYYIEEDGIEFDDNKNVVAIKARMINDISAPKLKLSREDQEIDTDGDGVNDDEARILDFPQIYFFDMREISDEIQEACFSSSVNNFLVEEDDTDDIEDIVEDSRDCIDEFLNKIRGFMGDILDARAAGEIPEPLDLQKLAEAYDELVECLGDAASDMCVYVVNSLNTSFKVLEDVDNTPLEDFPLEVLDASEETLEDSGIEGAALTGAREYAAGIGDSAIIGIGENATISITPRDSYDLPIGGDFSDKISLEIISDSTGSGEILENDSGLLFEKSGNDYFALVTAQQEGTIKLRARVCGRVIQAVTYSGIEEQITENDEDSEANCVPDPISSDEEDVVPIGALTKVDRIITLEFIKKATISTSRAKDGANSRPQVFGTNLEN